MLQQIKPVVGGMVAWADSPNKRLGCFGLLQQLSRGELSESLLSSVKTTFAAVGGHFCCYLCHRAVPIIIVAVLF